MSRKTAVGVAASAGQVVLTGGLLFALYAYARTVLGLEVFGVWSVVAGTAVSAQIAGLGLAGSAVKFVASALARGRPGEGADVAETTTIAVAVLVGAACLVLHPALTWLLPIIIREPHLLPAARLLLPYALASLWLSAVSSAVQACLDGASAVHWRAGLVSLGSVLFLGFTVALTPRLGLLGLAWAQVAQNAVVVIVGWWMLRRALPGVPIVPIRLHWKLLRRMIGYGLSFQAISILFLLLDPVAKAFIMRFGGAAWAGNFELANKLALQIRNVIVMGHQAMVPMLASLHERAPEQLRALYVKSLRVVLVLVCAAFPFSLAAAPFVAFLWLGHADTHFVAMLDLLLLSWFFNVLSGPAYFAYLGTGKLRWNVAGHLVKGGVNLGLGLLLGSLVGGMGVVFGYTAAIILGSAVPVWMYQREAGLRVQMLVDKAEVGAMVGAAMVALAGGGAAMLALSHARPVSALLVLAGCALWGIWTVWHHPLRLEMQRLTSAQVTL